MASKKNFKKDIQFLVDEVVGTCLMRQEMKRNDKKEKEKTDEIIKDMIRFQEDMINKVNNPGPEKGKKTLRKYYNELYTELLDKVNGDFEELGKEQ